MLSGIDGQVIFLTLETALSTIGPIEGKWSALVYERESERERERS